MKILQGCIPRRDKQHKIIFGETGPILSLGYCERSLYDKIRSKLLKNNSKINGRNGIKQELLNKKILMGRY